MKATSTRFRPAQMIPLIILAMIAVVSLVTWRAGYSAEPVLSGSMEPTIMTGSLAITRPITPDAVVPASVNKDESTIMVFPKPGRSDITVAHRVLQVKDGKNGEKVMQTKGDNNNAPDVDLVHVTADSHIREVVTSIPYMGYVVQWAGTPGGRFTLLGLALLVLFGGGWKSNTKNTDTSNELVEGGAHTA